MRLYQFISRQIRRIAFMEGNSRAKEADEIRDQITALMRNHFPRGSGIDNGTTWNEDKTTEQRIVFDTSFHHMDDNGFYDGWTEHQIVITPDLSFDMTIRVTGRDRNQIKDYLSEVYSSMLMEDKDENEWRKLFES